MATPAEFESWCANTPIKVVLDWAVRPGHYGIIRPLIVNCFLYFASRKEHETEALRERVKDE